MPKRRPQISGYERIAQAEVAEDDQEERAGREGPTANYNDGYDGNAGNTGGPTIALHGPQYAPIQPGRHESMPAADTHRHNKRRSVGGSPRHRRQRSNSGIDIKAINARLERWADEIASKLRIRRVRGKTPDEERLEIAHSVFQAPAWIQPVIAADMVRDRSAGESERMTDLDFEKAVDDVRTAIELGTHPTLISQGSSGSYFARTADGKVVGVFKPKDEEPYASRNPKWTKWIHRNLFPFFFGRACLIPNLSYVSEAAAYVLDCQLQTNLVPYTDVVSLSSKSFHYDLWDRRAFYRKKKPLPEKVGSFQVFLKGYQDATHFLREHPWPDQPQSTFRALALPRQKRRRSRRRNASKNASVASDDDDEASELTASEPGSRAETDFWTAGVRQPFREELEKLVILDYIMRNTDRGLDNWMIRFDGPHSVGRTGRQTKDVNGNASSGQNGSLTAHHDADKSSTEAADAALRSRMIIGAIDNSLSWPWKHPDAWRSYPFGWLFLPASLIGQPFSDATRRHFLSLLTSKDWWSETQLALRGCFAIDADFKEKMFARQLAVMKGQAWNVVETLKTPDHGPLELTRRARVLVWDDLVDVPVAVRMHELSMDLQRRRRREDSIRSSSKASKDKGADDVQLEEEDGEMDISTVRSTAPAFSDHYHRHQPSEDLIGPSTPPPTGRPANPFNISRHESFQNAGNRDESLADALSPASAKALAGNSSPSSSSKNTRVGPTSKVGSYGHGQAYGQASGKDRRTDTLPLRSSHDESRRRRSSPHRSRFSLSGRSPSSHLFWADDGDEGDLGFAVAENLERNRKRVIIERIEMVKSKNPVFTWC